MKENTTNIDGGKGNKMPINTKILIAILAVLVIGVGYALAAPSIKESREQTQREQAAEQLFGKKQVEAWKKMSK